VIPSAVYAGEMLTVAFIAKGMPRHRKLSKKSDAFNNSMAGKIDVQIHASTSTGMKFKGLNLQQIQTTGVATFPSIGNAKFIIKSHC
jgi:hypothetical protein